MKKIIMFLILIFAAWILHGILLFKVSTNEIAIKEMRKKVDELGKQVSKKEMEYDAIIDLEKIEKEMKAKENMSISKEIKFFRIEN